MFGFTRNILARAISMYRYLTHFMPKCQPVAWSEFCVDPFVLGDVCGRAADAGKTCCQQSPEHQYVHVLPQAHCFTTASNESVRPRCSCCAQVQNAASKLDTLLHCCVLEGSEQLGSCVLCAPLQAVDWLGRVEHFEADLAVLMHLLNSRPGVPQLQLPAQAIKTNSIAEQAPCQRRSRRRLLDAVTYTITAGTFNPCDPADYFRWELALQCTAWVLVLLDLTLCRFSYVFLQGPACAMLQRCAAVLQ